MNLTKKRVAELEGARLDWAVMMALGYRRYSGPWWKGYGHDMLHEFSFAPSTDWVWGGPIIGRERIWLAAPIRSRTEWSAAVGDDAADFLGSTPLIAAMRAFVASKLGDEIEVPA